jgi:hypothetical protein
MNASLEKLRSMGRYFGTLLSGYIAIGWSYKYQILTLLVSCGAVYGLWHYRAKLSPWLEDIPDFVGFFLAMVGVALLFLPEFTKMLDNHPIVRMVIAAFFMAAGVAGLYINHVSRHKSEEERHTLQGQIGKLVDTSVATATHEDVNRIDRDVQTGFGNVVTAIGNIRLPNPPPIKPNSATPPTTPPLQEAPQSIRFTQKRVPSTDPKLLYALQVIVQTDAPSTPVSFAFDCTGPIADLSFFIAGQSAYMSVQYGTNSNVGTLKIGYPPLTPDSPLVVTILSKDSVQVQRIRRIP